MRIGYSFWGFLGHGIVDTPDGGRSHRRVWIDTLRRAGHELVFLQRNRDLLEAGEDLHFLGKWEEGFPDLDLLFLEWRWPIRGRNVGIERKAPSYTPDWDRQVDLLAEYTKSHRLPTVIWDKDQMLEDDNEIRRFGWVKIAEAGLDPRPGAHRLLFPIDDETLAYRRQALTTKEPIKAERDLVYVGNQYGRDDVFAAWFVPAASRLRHDVFGKWTRTEAWPTVRFRGRVPFSDVAAIYQRSVATLLLAPQRYRTSGQFTQRLFEAVLEGCFAVAVADLPFVDIVVPAWALARDADQLASVVARLATMRREDPLAWADAIGASCDRLAPFLASRQLIAFMELTNDI